MPSPIATDPRERFHSKCRPSGQCLIWTGRTGPKGHGIFDVRPADGVGRSRPVAAYRWIYERMIGPIPDGASLHHTCERPACVNVDHLVPVDAWEHKAEHRSEACPTCGTPWDDANTYVNPRTGYRRCRTCHARRVRDAKRRRSKGRPPLLPCGTNAAWARHRRNGESPCDACHGARLEYVRSWKARLT